MNPFITDQIVESILSVRESFDRDMPLERLENLGWTRDEEGWLILGITDTVSIQASCDGKSVGMEVWIDDWLFGRVTDVKVHGCNGRRVIGIKVEDGSMLVYPIRQMEVPT